MSFKDNEPVGSFFMPMKNVLSLFNGISALHLALDQAGIEIDTCYYAEIDKYANKITEHHYPDDVALGDVTKWREWDIDWASIDLVGAGFPCQAWSVAGKQLGDKDERGMLFWTTLEIIAHVLKHNPKAKFLMENVKMKKDFEEYITHHTTQALGYVEKTLINSALVSAQNRNRYYWTNFEVTQPKDKDISLGDIIEGEPEYLYSDLENDIRAGIVLTEQNLNGVSQTLRRALSNGKNPEQKANSLTACAYKGMGTNGMTNVLICGGAIRGRYDDGSTSQRLEVNNTGRTNTLTTVQKDNVVVFRPASIVGRRLNERGVRDDYNKDVAITQCLQVKHKNDKTGCLTTVDKDNVLSVEPPGRYPDIYNRCDISYRKLTPLECERLQTFPEIKKSAIIEFSEKHGKIEWLLEHQRTNVSVGAKYRKLQSSALSAEEKELNQCASAAMSCLSISQADQEMPAQKNVHIILGEGQLQLNYQGKTLLSVNVAELLKKQVHPALGADIAQEIAGINSILEKILHNGKGGLPVSPKSSTHQESGSSNAGRYGQEIELGVKDAKLSAVQDLMDTYTMSDHGQNLKTLDLNLQTLFYSVSSVIDLFTLEKIQKGTLLKISIEYSCGFTSMLSNTQRYKALGNAWTVDVIAHIFKCMQRVEG